MGFLAKIAEQKIRAAMKRGEFDNLAYHGKPLQLDDLPGIPAPLRMGYKILKNAGVTTARNTIEKGHRGAARPDFGTRMSVLGTVNRLSPGRSSGCTLGSRHKGFAFWISHRLWQDHSVARSGPSLTLRSSKPKLSFWCAGGLAFGVGRTQPDESRFDHGAHRGIWPDRAAPQCLEFCGDRLGVWRHVVSQ
ncbi:hypothetical protein NKDENANG_01732 [Candidatus Entotheonellaceae bacterium PAL068K]